MNKQELIDNMATDTKLPRATVKAALESFIKNVEKSLKKKDPVVLTGFGTFDVIKRKARTGVNPATGETMQIAAKRVPKFKPGKRLKELVS